MATTAAVDVPLDVLVVGAGITGIYQLYRALESGFSAELLEAGSGIGGTWFWNRYPGARFDSESYTYGYLFSKELWDEWEWREHFAEQPEIERYLNHVVDRFDLRRHIHVGAKVTSAIYDESSSTWTVATEAGARYRARYLISSTGVLSVPHFPAVPGRPDFRGEQHHTGLWPASPVDFAGKRVAIIGTGSSGVQLVPIVAKEAASLAVYQRSANWCTPLNNSPIAAEEQARLRTDFESIRETLNTSSAGFLHLPHDRATFDDPEELRREFYEKMWRSPGFSKLTSNYTDLLLDLEANGRWTEFLTEKICSIVHDPDTAAKLIPKHRYGEHRPPFVTGYFETFNQPNVSLVDLSSTPLVAGGGERPRDGGRDSRVRHHRVGHGPSTSARVRCGEWGSVGAAAFPSKNIGLTDRRPFWESRPPNSPISSSPGVRMPQPATTRATTVTRWTSSTGCSRTRVLTPTTRSRSNRLPRMTGRPWSTAARNGSRLSAPAAITSARTFRASRASTCSIPPAARSC